MRRANHRQAGFSIISLMIASSIGIFLIGGAGKIYIDSKNAFNARSAISSVGESSRFAVQDLRRYLVMAGRGVSKKDDAAYFYTLADNNLRTFPTVDPDDTVASTSTGIIDQDNNDSSAVAVRYKIGPRPCGHISAPLTEDDDETHTVRFYRNNDAELVCQDIQTTPTGLVTVYERAMVSGIVLIRALYGIDTDADGFANQYLTATEVDNAGRWINVVSIRIGLVTSSDTNELPHTYRPSTAEEMGMLGMDVTTELDTSHSFKSASTTIALRNLNSSGGLIRQ
ncbi:MAG: PilW family protein [Candidatus Thiodiazotropha endolucinida]